jgi:hypothetical protein
MMTDELTWVASGQTKVQTGKGGKEKISRRMRVGRSQVEDMGRSISGVVSGRHIKSRDFDGYLPIHSAGPIQKSGRRQFDAQ